ncbi:MAG: carbohydrate porin, partial [Bacteriovoracia bacterium]
LNQVASENTDIGEPKTTALDFRLFDAPLTDKDQLNFWGAYGHTPEATKNDGTYLSETHSFVAGVRYRRQLEGGFNDLAITYGNKLLREFTLPETPYDDPDNDEYVIGDAFSFRVVEHLSTTITDNLQTYFSLIYERKDTGKSGDATISWYSVGARPVYFFSDAASLAFEAGYSLVEADQAFNDNSSGSHRLARFTLAGQLHPPIKNIWTRPVLRAFITHSRWNDNNIGEVGGDAYANKTDATQFGFQTEVWF